VFPATKRLAETIRDTQREVDIQRALVVTRVYQESEREAQITRRAKALSSLLSAMDIYIQEGELIVGNPARKPKAGPLFPEYAQDWILSQMDTFATRPGDRFLIGEGDKALLGKTLPYWKGRSLRDRWLAALPEETLSAMACGVVANENYTMSGPGHLVPDYEKLLRLGLSGIKEEIARYATQVPPKEQAGEAKLAFYRAALQVCDAAIAYAHRYAHLAEEMAAQASEPLRRAQLREVARICRCVPERPATTFWEVLQSIWFLQVITQIESNGLSIALGRFDQYLYPFYKKDMASGRLTRGEALNLLECFFCKLAEINKVYSNEGARLLAGPSQGQTLTLAGSVAGDRDGTNELTSLCLEADADVRMAQPDLALRVSDLTPEPVLLKAAEAIRAGLGKPKVFGDLLVTQALVQAGVPAEDAREWAALGCSEPVIPGKTDSWGNCGQVCLAKCLELALNDGRCRLTGERLGPATGDPRGFTSFLEVMAAFKRQLDYFVGHLVTANNILDRLHAEVCPVPFISLFISDCLAKGMEMNAGGARYNFTSPVGVGLITTADSLAAIKRLVFEERALTMPRLLSALDTDFDGEEHLRQPMSASASAARQLPTAGRPGSP
jgi:pyruvate formate-lyase/glycerol dehydratase family glycyl radical enzyme